MKRLQHSQFIPLIIFLLFFLGKITAQRRVSHGDTCNRINRCDSRAALTCKNGKCECIMPETMSYDSRYARCSVFAGEKCIYTAVESETRNNERSWREEMPCVNNAVCQEGFCTCFQGFYEGSNGTCEIKRGHREDCESDAACRNDQFLVCTEEKACDCHSKTATYDFSRQTCVRKANQPCSDLQFCVNNAYCRVPQNPELVSGVICECENNYFASEDGKCETKRGFGENCTSDDYCRNDDYFKLTCNSDGRCGCNSNVSIYENSTSMCRRLAGASCHGYPYCVENSECGRSRYYDFDVDVECECNSGYFQTQNGTCERKHTYGEICLKDDNCQQGLKCKVEGSEAGICQCDMGKSIYDSVKKRCVGLANSTCESSEACITNSECGWSRDDARRCTCLTGFAPSSNGSCLASYRMRCSSDWTGSCNKEQGLICKEGVCQCKYENFQTFDLDRSKCVSSASGPCDESIPCSSDSFCKIDQGGYTSQRCQCNEGFIEVNGNCQLSYGQSCNYTIDIANIGKQCDSFAPLFCIEGKCQCDYLKVYDKITQTCKGLVGALCDSKVKASPCVSGAICVERRVIFTENKTPNAGICKCKSGREATTDGFCNKKSSPKPTAVVVVNEDTEESFVIDKNLQY